MKRIKINLLLIFLVSFQINFVQAQIQKGAITKNNPISTELLPTKKHQYTVKMGKNKFAFFRLMQQGIDVKITTYNPKGEKLEEFDSPNGKNGPEYFSITSSKKGKYIVEVTPFSDKAEKGNYSLVLNNIKSKATTPSGQVDELFTSYSFDDTPGAAVAVVKDGAIIYKKGYGQANLEYDIPNSPSTVFHIASVSKQFTAFSILLLEKEGKLSLDDDIRKYIPEVPDFGKTITLRHLASHTSGMRDQWNLLVMAGWRMDDVITKDHVLKLVSKQQELNFNPGDEYTYCNTGFTLLAEVVARVSGQSFAEFTQKNIFKPLNMNSTLFYDDHEKIVKNRAYSYYSTSNGYKKSVLSYANVGATSLFTTVEDLSLWAMNFSNIKVGDEAIIKKLNTQAVLNNGQKFGGALGQFVGKYKGLNEIQHGGADAGYRTYLTRFPDENFAVVVFSNAAEFNSGGYAYKIVDIYLKDKIKKEAKPKEKPKSDKKEGEKVTVSSEILKTYIGDFELQPGFVITISEADGQLTGKATGQPTFPLEPISETEFKVVGVEAKIVFEPNHGENIKSFKLHQGGQIMECKRVKTFDKSTVNLADFEGSYYSEELTTTYHFKIVDGKLTAQHRKSNDFTLEPTGDDMFSANVWYFGQVKFVRDDDKAIIGCKVTNGRVRNLHFKKLK
jgi:CubicO group peptidase (beta-lactamase class C family)